MKEFAIFVGGAIVMGFALSFTGSKSPVNAAAVAKLEIQLREAQRERDRAKLDLQWEQQTSHILRVINDMQKRECPPK